VASDVTDQMSLYNVTQKERHIYCWMRLLADEKTVHHIVADQICRRAFGSVEASHWDLTLWILDNLGFHMKVGYDQWTIILVVVIPHEVLLSKQIYGPERLSREARIFDELVEREGKGPLVQQIIKAQTKDKRLYSKHFLSHVHYAKNLEVPSLKDCTEMIQTGKYNISFIICKNLEISFLAVAEQLQVNQYTNKTTWYHN
jgi:hypothetical protein